MDALAHTTVLFTIALTLSMIVERILEICKCTFDLFDARYNWHRFWTHRACILRDKLEKRLRIYEYANQAFINKIIKAGHSILLESGSDYDGIVPTVSGDLVRALWLKIILKVVGVLIGVFLAIQFGVDFIALWQNTNITIEGASALTDAAKIQPTTLGMLITGAAIGLGSGPVHKIISSMEGSWEKKKKIQKMRDL